MRIVFDLDGTLIDSLPDIHAASVAVMAEEGLPTLPRDVVRSFIGNGVAVLVTRCLAAVEAPGDAARHARMVARFEAIYETAVVRTELYPGVLAALDALAGSGARLGICTNKPIAATRTVLRHFGLDHRFGAVLGGDSLRQRKPDPAPLRAVLDALGGGPSLYVGDSEVDAETATRAGVPFLLFTEGYRKASVADLAHAAAFADFTELPALAAVHAA